MYNFHIYNIYTDIIYKYYILYIMNNFKLINSTTTHQPYSSWKGFDYAYNAYTPLYSRPFSNKNIQYYYNVPPIFIYSRKNNKLKPIPRPLKHWRYKLMPEHYNNSISKTCIRDTIDVPGSSVVTNRTLLDEICTNQSTAYINNNSNCCIVQNKKNLIRTKTSEKKLIITSNEEPLQTRILTTYKQYLQSRVKTYDQNVDVHFDKNNNINYYFPPSDSCNGSQIMNNIKISVIMSFFNSENYLFDSINHEKFFF